MDPERHATPQAASTGTAGSHDGRAPVDRQALLTLLTTEHFTLQGARASTVSESSARAALFVGAVTSTLVALGFIVQPSELGSAFDTFVLVVLPTLYVLGLFTFVRLVTSSTEDLRYGRAINRIRGYYQEVAGDEARYLLLGGHDDTLGVLANMGVARPSRWQLYFTFASMVAVLDAVVGGSAMAFVAGVAGATLGPASGIGAVTGVVSCSLQFRWQRRAHTDARRRGEVLFPSPTSAGRR
jgi:hypothetical protein